MEAYSQPLWSEQGCGSEERAWKGTQRRPVQKPGVLVSRHLPSDKAREISLKQSWQHGSRVTGGLPRHQPLAKIPSSSFFLVAQHLPTEMCIEPSVSDTSVSEDRSYYTGPSG